MAYLALPLSSPESFFYLDRESERSHVAGDSIAGGYLNAESPGVSRGKVLCRRSLFCALTAAGASARQLRRGTFQSARTSCTSPPASWQAVVQERIRECRSTGAELCTARLTEDSKLQQDHSKTCHQRVSTAFTLTLGIAWRRAMQSTLLTP